VSASVSAKHSLQETGDLPGAKYFAGSFLPGTGQRIPGKVLLPANQPLPGVKLPAKSSRRQTTLFAEGRHLAKLGRRQRWSAG